MLLRAKIDMSFAEYESARPGALSHSAYQRISSTGDAWSIYPMYDFAHTLSDAFEGITHSFARLSSKITARCTTGFSISLKPAHRPRQIEFSRLNLAYAITSKRKLNALVEEGIVEGWDDPRMPTIAGMRRRGYPAAALREFVSAVASRRRTN